METNRASINRINYILQVNKYMFKYVNLIDEEVNKWEENFIRTCNYRSSPA